MRNSRDYKLFGIKELIDQRLVGLDEELRLAASRALLPGSEVFLTQGQVNGVKALVMGPVPAGTPDHPFLTVFHPMPFEDPEEAKREERRFDQILQLYHAGFRNGHLGRYIARCLLGTFGLFLDPGELMVHLAQGGRHRTYRVGRGSPTLDLAVELGARQYAFLTEAWFWWPEEGAVEARVYGTLPLPEEEGGDLEAMIAFSIPEELYAGGKG